MIWRIVIKFLGSAGRFVFLDDSSWSSTEGGAGCGRETGTSCTENKFLCSFSHCRCTAMCGRTWLLGPSTAVGSRWSIVKFSTPGTLSSAFWASALPQTTMWDHIRLVLNAPLVDIADIEPCVLMHILDLHSYLQGVLHLHIFCFFYHFFCKAHITESTWSVSPPKATQSTKSDSSVSRGTNSNSNFDQILWYKFKWNNRSEFVSRNLSFSIGWISGVQHFQWNPSFKNVCKH